ncbi:hypothetical protein ACWCP6_20585 [Streptomyces sp. NPDC002004]
MWPGQQPPGGEQNPQDQNQNPYQQPGYQQPNPYQQPGYQQANPYAAQQPGQPGQPGWGAPTVPMGAPQPPGDNGKKTKIVAIVAAAAVVVAAGVTGVLVLGGKKSNTAKGGDGKHSASPKATPSKDPSSSGNDDPRNSDGPKPTIPGWKVVVNPKWGTAFDVPADWMIKSPDTFTFVEDTKKGGGAALIGMTAPAYLKEKWCTSDDDHDGTPDDKALAIVGTKGQNGAKNTEDVARNDSAWWVFGSYTGQTEKEKKLLHIGKPKAYTTASGVKGSVATTYSAGVSKTGKCDSDGKAITFAFKNSNGDFVSWTLKGAKGVKEELSDATIMKILSTVRLEGDPTD